MTEVLGHGSAELFAVNQQLQEAPAVRLLAANNLAAYVTLMERHLDHVAKITESELRPRLEQDLDSVGLGDLTALVLIKRWSRDGLARQINEAIASAQSLLEESIVDSPTKVDFPIGALAALLAEQAPIDVYLACPRLRAAAAGMDRFAASVSTLAASSLVPESILIVENRKLGNTLDLHAPDLAVLYGLGYGATALADLRWTATAKTIMYWGDIDRAGLAILASLRRAGMNVQSVLMDEQTWDRYPDQQHYCARDQGLSDADVPEGLEEPERRLYERLNQERRHRGKDLQLEQEHIPIADVITALRAFVACRTHRT